MEIERSGNLSDDKKFNQMKGFVRAQISSTNKVTGYHASKSPVKYLTGDWKLAAGDVV